MAVLGGQECKVKEKEDARKLGSDKGTQFFNELPSCPGLTTGPSA